MKTYIQMLAIVAKICLNKGSSTITLISETIGGNIKVFFKTVKLAAAMVVGLGTFAASAATTTYDLFDHPNRAIGSRDYGLRIDEAGKFFSFTAGSATLVYDDVLNKVRISGTMVESLPGNTFGAVWTVKYTIENVTNIGAGLFQDFSGSGVGSITDGVTTLALGAQARPGMPPNGGDYFILDNDASINGITGAGWVNVNDPGCCNDFLFVAENNGAPGGIVPIPAAAWMLLSGVAGLGVVARRRRQKS